MITAEQLQRDLTKWTVDHSRYEDSRNYIGLSSIWDCPAAIVRRYLNGNPDPGLRGRLKCYKGYQIEDDIVTRLVQIYAGDPHWFKRNVEVSIRSGLVQGHIELVIDGIPVDVKSVPLDEHLPGKLPRKPLWQMQAYLRYRPADRGIVIYESRESGLLRAFDVVRDDKFGESISEKVENLVWWATKGIIPKCDCGKCPVSETQFKRAEGA